MLRRVVLALGLIGFIGGALLCVRGIPTGRLDQGERAGQAAGSGSPS